MGLSILFLVNAVFGATKFLAPEDAFQFTVDCQDLGPVNCSQATQSLNEVGIMIAKDILFQQPVNVEVIFKLFDQAGSHANSVVKNYSPMKVEYFSEIKQYAGNLIYSWPRTIGYPVAVLKSSGLVQLGDDGKHNDIRLTINTKYNFNYSPNSTATKGNEIDIKSF